MADPSRWQVHYQDELRPVCCPGCQAVATAILAGGFDHYYRLRREPAVRPGDIPAQDDPFAGYDDEAFEQGLITLDEDGRASMQLLVEDIHCAACCWLIEQALLREKGVEAVSVNLATRRVRIRWQRQELKPGVLFQKLQAIGYRAVPAAINDTAEQESFRRRDLLRLGIAGIAMMQAMMFALAIYSGDFSGMEDDHRQFMRVFSLMVSLPVMFYSAIPFYEGAWRNLRARRVGMDVPVSLALWIAFIASVFAVVQEKGDVYFDSISMFVFLLLLSRYVDASARRYFFNRQTRSIHAVNVKVGDQLVIRAGETIPVDGVIREGESSVNESMLTGESLPFRKSVGDIVYAGCINGEGVLTISVTAVAGQTRLDLIEQLADEALAGKAPVEQLADRLAFMFTLLVLLLAAAAGWYWQSEDPSRVITVVLSVLVVSCPCALSLATPSALAMSTLALRRRGILLVKPGVVDRLAGIGVVIFDKTGTLTQGAFSITQTQLLSADVTQKQVLEIAAALEGCSEHPLASAFSGTPTDLVVTRPQVTSGAGVSGYIDGVHYRIGSRAFCEAIAGPLPVSTGRARVFLAMDKSWLAAFVLEDVLRDDAASTLRQLHQQGFETLLLSGDASGMAETLAASLAMSSCRAACTPEQKLITLRQIQDSGRPVLMVGDGINDLPVLAAAEVSVAMRGANDLAKLKADAVLLTDHLAPLLALLDHARKTRRIIRENLAWALLYNVLALPLAAAGLVAPWLAALGMSLSSLLVTLNSLRLRLAS